MHIEIERKFLVKSDLYKSIANSSLRIIQGYLSSHPLKIVRIRIYGNRAYITIKGPSNDTGTSRYEWEKEISVSDGHDLLSLCEPGVIDKTRYLVNIGSHIFEVDEFHGDNSGLVVAEIELSSENEIFVKPEWLGEEVTGDKKYYNAMLIKYPFVTWEQ